MRAELTDRQRQVLDALVAFQNEHGYPPSVREMMPLLGVTSLRGVTIHLDALQRKGWIERGRTSRSIRILAFPTETDDTACAAFALKMPDDTMIGDHIARGDNVIVRSQSDGVHGSLLAVQIGSTRTVRRLDASSDRPRLLCSDSEGEPIDLVEPDARVLGVVTGLIRHYGSP